MPSVVYWPTQNDYDVVKNYRYRRNLLTFSQNSSLLNHWTLFTLLMSCIIALPMLGVAKVFFTPVNMFWLHNLLYFGFIDFFHGILLPLTIISVPVEPEKASFKEKFFYVRTSLVLEPRRPQASGLVPLRSGRSLVDKNIEYQAERKPLFILTPLLQKSKELSVHDPPIFLPLGAQSRPDLSSQVKMAEIRNEPYNHMEAPSTKVSAPREELKLSLHETHSRLLSHNHLLDPKDFQHMVNSILRYSSIIHSKTSFLSYKSRKCSQNEHSSLDRPEVISIYVC